MTQISVIIGTYGDPKWQVLARERAARSVRAQTLSPEIILSHQDTLHEARNAGAEKASGDHLIFLDADDELDRGYIEAMSRATRFSWSLYQPSTLGIVDGIEDPQPVLIPRRPLHTGNFMVIGTMVPKDLFFEVGGFLDWPIYEDWCLWIRCHQAGASFVAVPEAIYRIHVTQKSRNQQSPEIQARYFKTIRGAYYR